MTVVTVCGTTCQVGILEIMLTLGYFINDKYCLIYIGDDSRDICTPAKFSCAEDVRSKSLMIRLRRKLNHVCR